MAFLAKDDWRLSTMFGAIFLNRLSCGRRTIGSLFWWKELGLKRSKDHECCNYR